MRAEYRKEKGKRLQKLVAELISELTGLECGPDCPIEPRQSSQNGTDIRLDTEARKRFPFSVECKNQESWSLPSAIQQAKANKYPDTDWLVVLAKNRFKPVVVMDCEVFFQLMTKLRDGGDAEEADG